jgi:hypothetical protein
MTTTTIPAVTERENRQFRITMRWFVLLVVVILAVLVGRWFGIVEEQSADITVQPCSAYTPQDVPPHTFAGACALPDGSLYIPQNKN